LGGVDFAAAVSVASDRDAGGAVVGGPAMGDQLHRESLPLLDLPWDIAESGPGRTMAPLVYGQRPERELYDLLHNERRQVT
jgi:hypothetical protein